MRTEGKMSRKVTVSDVDALVNGIMDRLNRKIGDINSVMNSPDTSPQSKVIMGAAKGAIGEIAKVIVLSWNDTKAKMPADAEPDVIPTGYRVDGQAVCQCKAPKAEKQKLELTPAQAAAQGRRDNKGHFAPRQKQAAADPGQGGTSNAEKTEGNA